MIRTAVVICALLSIALPLGAAGQTTAQSDGHTYTDPGMSYTAPADFAPLPVPSSAPDTFAQPTVVAAFARHQGQSDATLITLTMENTDEDLTTYEQDVESKARNHGNDSVFVKKELTTLSNGMPAYFLDITISQDAGELRSYEYVWVDRLRGVQLAVSGRFGSIDDRAAKKAMSNVSAVACPRNRY